MHGNRTGLGTQAVETAGHLCNVGVELFYTLHKLMYAVALGLLEHLVYVLPLLLSRIAEKHCDKVEHYAVIK
jgi:hypothetical protein